MDIDKYISEFNKTIMMSLYSNRLLLVVVFSNHKKGLNNSV